MVGSYGIWGFETPTGDASKLEKSAPVLELKARLRTALAPQRGFLAMVRTVPVP